jgi:capping protein alpha
MNSRYNQDQFVQCELDGSNEACLITEFNELSDGRYYDPRTKKSFKFDHLHFKTSEYETYNDIDMLAETWRLQIEKEFTQYVKIHYQKGACSVYGSSDQGHVTIVVCIEAHKFQPSNFWNARWRSRWAITFQPNQSGNNECEVDGVIKAQVHYYEDGNVQLVSQKDNKDTIRISEPEHTAKEMLKIVEKAENEYQVKPELKK